MEYLLAITTFTIALCLGGCASEPGKVYSGKYFYNFESSSFMPDGTQENWCLDGNMKQAELPAKSQSGPWGTSHVVVRGQLSPPGHYCNLGGSKYILKVFKVIEVTDRQAQAN
jgi:uncharacterized protein YceK